MAKVKAASCWVRPASMRSVIPSTAIRPSPAAAASADSEVIAHIKHLISTARVGRDYDHDEIGYNFRMTNVQAAIGVAQVERLADFLAAKQRIRDAYAAFAGRHAMLHPFPEPPFGRYVHWFSGFWYGGQDDAVPAQFRDHMRACGVDLRPFWKPIHLQLPYQAAPRSAMPVCEDLWSRIFALPCSTHLRDDELKQVLDAAEDFWSKRG